MRARTKGMGKRGEVLNEFGGVVRTRKSMIEAARELRKTMTTTEKLLWDCLKRNARGIKFYRQVPIDRFIVDFYCPRERLIIEIDGGVHADPDVAEHDMLREEFLKQKNLRILRFRNEEIIRDVYAVYRRILRWCTHSKNTNMPLPHRSAEGGRGRL